MPKIGKTNRKPDRLRNGFEMRFTSTGIEADPDEPKIGGYAAVFSTPVEIVRGLREQVAPGAFAKSIGVDDVRGLLNHDPNYVLGRTSSGTLRLMEDATGLRFEVDPPDTQWARDLMVTMRRRDVSGGSFGFRVVKDSWEHLPDGDELRTIEEAKLLDVSVVTYPAYPATQTHVRSVAGIDLDEIADLYGRIRSGELNDEERARIRALGDHLVTVTGDDRDELDLLRRRLALADIL